MNQKDKEFTFNSSVAGGFVAGGTLLAYQLLLGFGWGIAPSAVVAIIAGIIIVYIARQNLFFKSKKK